MFSFISESYFSSWLSTSAIDDLFCYLFSFFFRPGFSYHLCLHCPLYFFSLSGSEYKQKSTLRKIPFTVCLPTMCKPWLIENDTEIRFRLFAKKE